MKKLPNRIFLRIFLATFLLFIFQNAFSWGLLGHRIVGEIAQQHLSKKAKKELRKLIGRETLAWWSNCVGISEHRLLAELPAHAQEPAACWFPPYLSGERTPHNDAAVRGAFLHLDAGVTRQQMTQAVLEGVAHAFRDARDALVAAGTPVAAADLIGGGTRSDLWCDVLAQVLNVPLRRVDGATHGPALGAARLARAALSGELHFPRAASGRVFEPRAALVQRYADAHERWSDLYRLVRQVPALAPATIAEDLIA